MLTDSKVHGANMGPTWVLLAPDGPHVGPMNFAIKADILQATMFHTSRYCSLLHMCIHAEIHLTYYF